MEQNTSVEQVVAHPLPTINSLISEAWELYKSRLQTFLTISLLLVLFELIFLQNVGSWLGVFLAILFIVFTIFLQAVILGNVIKSEDIGFFQSIKYAAENFDKYIWISVLVMLVTLAGAVLIIPALIWSVSLSFAIVVLAAEGSTGMKALLQSREYVRGRWWNVFIAIFTFQILLFLLPTIILSVLNIPALESIYAALITPLSMVYVYILYKHLKASRPEIEVSINDGKKFQIFAILGILVIIIAIVLGVTFKDFLEDKGFFEQMKLQTQIK